MQQSVLKVLYIEDNRTHVSLMEKVFKRIENAELIVAYDGLIGCERAKRLKPDILLVDINLPRLSGIDIVKQLRALPCFDELPIYALTADVMLHNQDSILNSGIDQIISKPIDVRQFINFISEAA